MSNAFKDVDRASYNLFARMWDAHSAKLSGPYAETLLRLARVGPGMRVLEVCCGTGVISRAAARAVEPRGSVLGTDLTPGMIEVAIESAATKGIANAAFRVMDCETLELEDGSFDAGVAMYPHFTDHRKALGELRRVVRPGGWVAIGVGGGPPRTDNSPRPVPLAMSMMNDVIRRYQPEDPGDEHALRWSGDDPNVGLPAVLAEAGFLDVETAVRTEKTLLDSPEEAWDIWSMTASPVRHRLSLLAPEQREAVRREFLAELAPLANKETLTRVTGAVYAAGRNPAN